MVLRVVLNLESLKLDPPPPPPCLSLYMSLCIATSHSHVLAFPVFSRSLFQLAFFR